MADTSLKPRDSDPLALLAGGGEMGDRIRAFDWWKTPVGPVPDWPQSLKTAVRIMLDARYPMFVWWGPGLTDFYNDAYIPVLGKRHPDAIGRYATEVWSDIWHVVGPQAQAALEGRATWSEEQLLLMERNGFVEETYFTYSYSPIHNDEGGIGGVFCACTEDTNRVLGQRRLRTLRALADQTARAKTVDSACEAILTALADARSDLPFILLYLVDDHGEQFKLAGSSGLDRNSSASPSVIELHEAAPWPFQTAAETGQLVEVGDLLNKFGPMHGEPSVAPAQRAVVIPMARTGQRRPAGFVVAGISPLLIFNDDYRGFLELLAGHIATTISNARSYEEERRRAEALAESDRSKTVFFSNVSHEFRTPLTLILGPLDDAIVESAHRWQRDRLELIRRNALRLQKLVNTLLDFSRIEAGKTRVHHRPVELASFTEELASNFRSACEKASLELQVDCPPLPQPVFVDPEMWEKIVLNLISNAFKFTLQGRIRVSLNATPTHAELVVADSGVGIPANQLPKLFERFHRVEGVVGRSQEGSGIGLALVRELVRFHSGDIQVVSQEGQGTSFTVSIPFGTAHLPSQRGESSSAFGTPSSSATHYVEEALRWLPDGSDDGSNSVPGLVDPELVPRIVEDRQPGTLRSRILLVDDNSDMRQYLTRLLSSTYDVRAVNDGSSALETLQTWLPDVILTDVMMPGLDGFGLIRALRGNANTRDLPVIMLSARAGEESRIEGMEAGADDYLVKPFSARELVARVSAHLQMARLRRAANQSIREGEERLRALVRASSDAVYRMSADWSEMQYLTGREFIPDVQKSSRTWLQKYIPPEDQPRVMEVIHEAVRTKSVFQLEHRVRRVDGTLGWTFSRAIPLMDADGEIAEWFGTATDITARKEMEVALQRSEERLRLITDSLPTLISYVDADGVYRLNNRAYEAWFKQPRSEVTGKHMRDVVGEAAWTVIGPKVEAARAGETVTYEAKVDYIEAGQRWIEATYVPHLDGNGQTVGIFVLVNDITMRKQAEEAIRESEARFRHMADSAPAMLWVTDPSGACTYLSSMWYEFTGRPPGSAEGFGWLEVVHPDDIEHAKQVFLEANKQRKPFSIDYRVRRHDGEYRWAVDDGQPYFKDGVFEGFVGSVFDVHERKLAEEANSELIETLREADRLKDEFLATLAHELRNPLAPLRNGLQVMKLGGDDAEAVEQARTMMERQLRQMVHLVDDLLDLSRISRGKIELRKERVELARVVQHAVETSRPVVEQAGHELTITLPPCPIYVDADVTRLAQVFSNLLNNAAKYTERQGRIGLTVRHLGSEAIVSVKDNGIGIPAHMLPKVFGMFTQVDHSPGRSQGGLGIGLTIVKRLVEMHGGSVEANSDGHGMGSEFIVRLPVVLSVAQTQSDDMETTRPSDGRRVLVVDDNRDAAVSMAMMLKLMGNQTKTAHDGLEALEVAEAFRPDLILLDIGMPRLNGYETARQIREKPWGKSVMLVALTGWGQEEDRHKSQHAGFDNHMVKPIEPALLETLLAKLKTDSA